jgi:flavin-binding protein dodecin
MSIARVVEITSTSKMSFEDAIQRGVDRASKTLRHIKSAWIKEQEVQIEGNKIAEFKVILKVTFVLEDPI